MKRQIISICLVSVCLSAVGVACKSRKFASGDLRQAGTQSSATDADFLPGDLSILAPMPASQPGSAAVGLSEYLKLSDFISGEDFAAVFPETVAPLQDNSLFTEGAPQVIKPATVGGQVSIPANWIIVGLRIEPCFVAPADLRLGNKQQLPKEEIEKCTFELRLVAQPFLAPGQAENQMRAPSAAFVDASAHLIYQTKDINVFKGWLGRLAEFSNSWQRTLQAVQNVTGVHPAFSQEPSQALRSFNALVQNSINPSGKENDKKKWLHELALAIPSSGGAQWDFTLAKFDEQGNETRVNIPLAGRDTDGRIGQVQAVTQGSMGVLRYFPEQESTPDQQTGDQPAGWDKDLDVIELGKLMGELFAIGLKKPQGAETSQPEDIVQWQQNEKKQYVDSKKTEFASGIGATYDVENPLLFNQRMGDCVSCHTAQPLRAMAVSSIRAILDKSDGTASPQDSSYAFAAEVLDYLQPVAKQWLAARAYSGPQEGSTIPGNPKQWRPWGLIGGVQEDLLEDQTLTWVVRHFGYIDTTPIVSQRTVNESRRAAEVLKAFGLGRNIQ